MQWKYKTQLKHCTFTLGTRALKNVRLLVCNIFFATKLGDWVQVLCFARRRDWSFLPEPNDDVIRLFVDLVPISYTTKRELCFHTKNG